MAQSRQSFDWSILKYRVEVDNKRLLDFVTHQEERRTICFVTRHHFPFEFQLNQPRVTYFIGLLIVSHLLDDFQLFKFCHRGRISSIKSEIDFEFTTLPPSEISIRIAVLVG